MVNKQKNTVQPQTKSFWQKLKNFFAWKSEQNTNAGHVNAFKSLKQKPTLYVKELSKRYSRSKVYSIQNVSFNVYPGEFHAFIGSNGAGKTTTIKSIIGSYSKWEGTILVNGIKNTDLACKKFIGYMPEVSRFPVGMSTFNYLSWMARLSDLPKEKTNELIEKWLKKLDMWQFKKRSPNSFSSGQKKKVLLIQTLIHSPKIVIMDEPTAMLDPQTRGELMSSLAELKKEGIAIFISSHVLDELDRYCDSLTIINGGKILYTGKKLALLNKYHDNLYTINTTNNGLLEKYLQNGRYLYIIDELGDYQINIKHSAMIEMEKKLSKQKVFFTKMKPYSPDLTTIYHSFVTHNSASQSVKVLKQRHAEIQNQIQQAEKDRQEAASKLAAAEKVISEAQGTAKTMKINLTKESNDKTRSSTS